jgi:hypothetical protein
MTCGKGVKVGNIYSNSKKEKKKKEGGNSYSSLGY